MLTVQALGTTGRPVVMPSFTFAATAHAAAWAGAEPRVRRVRADDFLLDVDDCRPAHRRGGGVWSPRTCSGRRAIRPQSRPLGRRHGVPVVFDAAHAFGATHHGRPIGGFGVAEVFSLSPTKVLVGGEGGLVTTGDGDLAARIRIGRDYGNPGTYDTAFVGLNARMSELHAALALASLDRLDDHLARRAGSSTATEPDSTGCPA